MSTIRDNKLISPSSYMCRCLTLLPYIRGGVSKSIRVGLLKKLLELVMDEFGEFVSSEILMNNTNLLESCGGITKVLLLCLFVS